VAAALEVGRELGPDGLVIVLIPDSGRGYLSRVFDDEWMAGYGFLRGGEHTVADILEARGREIPPLVYVRPEETVQRAVNVMRGYGLSQLPVAKGEMPLAAAEILGAVDEVALMDRAPAVVVLAGGRPRAVLSRTDVLEHLSQATTR
jgi:cystathionine beta-synthase